MSGIFISYRRGDSGPYAGRLYDSLKREFPDNRVFMDIDTIAPGDDFLEEIDKVLSVSKIVVAVIGPRWEDAADKIGRRRLDNQDDFVVHELGMALESGVRVIPVLVGDAGMPTSEVLPLRLRPLARRQAIEISDTRFTFDTARLCTAIKKVLSAGDKGAKLQDSPQASMDRTPPAEGEPAPRASAAEPRAVSTGHTPQASADRIRAADARTVPRASSAQMPLVSTGHNSPVSMHRPPSLAEAKIAPRVSGAQTSAASAGQTPQVGMNRIPLAAHAEIAPRSSAAETPGPARDLRNVPEHRFWHYALLSLFWLDYLLVVFILILSFDASPRGETLVGIIFISLILAAGVVFNVMALRYKKWARAGWILLHVSLFPSLVIAFEAPAVGTFVAIASVISALVTTLLMFTDPVRHRFDDDRPPWQG